MVEKTEIAKDANSAKKLAAKEKFVFYAGGTEINRLGSPGKAVRVVSLKNLKLNSISASEEMLCSEKKKCIKIGSMCTFTQLLESPLVPAHIKDALKFNASLQKRNMATIGGNIAAARDDSYLIPTLAAANAHVLCSGSTKAEPVLDYCLAEHGEKLIEYVLLPACPRKVKSYRCSNTASSHAVITAALGFCMKDGKIHRPVAAAAIKGFGIVRLKCVEEAIEKENEVNPENIEKKASGCSAVKLKDDILYGSKEYRKYLLGAAFRIIAENLLKDMKEGK